MLHFCHPEPALWAKDPCSSQGSVSSANYRGPSPKMRAQTDLPRSNVLKLLRTSEMR